MLDIVPLDYPPEQPAPHKDTEFDQNKIHYERFQ